MSDNIILMTDSYKQSHYDLLPPGTTHTYSYFESRGGKFPYTTFYGLQYIIKKYLTGSVITNDKISEAEEIINSHFRCDIFNRTGWEHILYNHKGYLPIEIKAVPEGTCVPVSNVLFSVQNTDPKVPWLPGFLETILCQVWYPTTVATNSREIKNLMDWHAKETSDHPEDVDFKCHDFGFRGVSSVESAGIGGSAHLISFKGTDTLEAISLIRKYYNNVMPGYSIPATEHSIMSSWGGAIGETSSMLNFLDKYPDGVIACVSDTYDIFNACNRIWGSLLYKNIMDRNGTLVIRPDSGDPLEISLSVLDILIERFNYTVNSKGYKVLDPHIRIIQGDGVSYDVISSILGAMKHKKMSIDNIAFGSGGALLQQFNRDTNKFAYKCSAIKTDGEWQDVFKNPVTDKGKRSKSGRFQLLYKDGLYETINCPDNPSKYNILDTVFKDGKLTRDQTFDDIRKRAKI